MWHEIFRLLYYTNLKSMRDICYKSITFCISFRFMLNGSFNLFICSSYAQSITTSTNIVETLLSSLICLLGLVFFALLIGNMQVISHVKD